MTPMKFHWRLPQAGEGDGMSRSAQALAPETGLPDVDAQVRFSLAAEECGIDSLLTDFNLLKPEPMILATALGLRTTRIKYIIACRSGLSSPTFFVQQLNTLSALIGGRFSLNVVAGHSPEEQRQYGDHLSHDERYARTEEFLAICNALWRDAGPVDFAGTYYRVECGRVNTRFVSPERDAPELFIAGGSQQARNLAISQGSCWMMLAEPPEKIRAAAEPVLEVGKSIGVRFSVIVRPTHEEALSAARELVARAESESLHRDGEKQFIARSDSVSMNRVYQSATEQWLTPYLWTGAVRYYGSSAIALVGSPAEIVEAIFDYRDAGVTQFIISGWPKLSEMLFFGHQVLPIIRRREMAAQPLITASDSVATRWPSMSADAE